MYTVILVDDENLVITSLKACANWEANGFTIIGEANDGVTALRLIEEMRPNLVFADIRMPGMSGLELVKRVHDADLGTLFVIISGYAEFAYVQKALNYGVLGYCLKPIDDGEFAQLLAKARDMLGKARAAKETELLLLLGEAEGPCDRIRVLLQEMGLEIDQGIIAAMSVGTELTLPAHIRHVRLKPSRNRTVYILRKADCRSFTDHLSPGLSPEVLGVGYSCALQDARYLMQAIEEAEIAANQYFMTGAHGIYEFSPHDQGALNAAFPKLEGSIMKRDIGQIQQALENLEMLMTRGGYNIKCAFKAYNTFMYSFCTESAEKYDNDLLDYKQLTGAFANVHDMFKYLKGLLMEYSGVPNTSAAPAARNDTFANILNFVNEHFSEDISIQTISRRFAVNPNYVSQLFKRQTGEKFTDYITRLKLNYACNLLKSTDLPVADVADRVGFSDYYYFSRVFKKLVGDTPSGYREKNSPA